MIDLVLIVLGAVVLAFAGSRLVDFAVAIAEKARLTPAVIGLTIVAAGTSMPELAVSVTGALRGTADIALGNVVGSNIANIGLILGACAALTAVPVARGVLRFEYPFLVLASWIVLLLARDGRLDRLEGAFFVASLIAFTAYAVWVARREIDEAEQGVVAERRARRGGAPQPLADGAARPGDRGHPGGARPGSAGARRAAPSASRGSSASASGSWGSRSWRWVPCCRSWP